MAQRTIQKEKEKRKDGGISRQRLTGRSVGRRKKRNKKMPDGRTFRPTLLPSPPKSWEKEKRENKVMKDREKKVVGREKKKGEGKNGRELRGRLDFFHRSSCPLVKRERGEKGKRLK